MFEIGMKHCLLVFYDVSSNKGSRVQDGPGNRVLGSNNRNTFKSIQKSSSEHLAQMLDILFLALSGGPLSSLFKWWPWS